MNESELITFIKDIIEADTSSDEALTDICSAGALQISNYLQDLSLFILTRLIMDY